MALHESDASAASAVHAVHDWFCAITGCVEREWRQLPIKPIEQAADDTLHIVNQQTKETYCAGTFSVDSIGSLVDHFSALDSSDVQRMVPLQVVTHSSDAASLQFGDVSYHQALPENAGAVFQVSSNFNGMECISEDAMPDDDDSFVTNYMLDRTQGPTASVSAGAAAITRVYAAHSLQDGQQTKDQQINFLGDLSEHFPVENGFIVLTGNEPHAFPHGPAPVHAENKNPESEEYEELWRAAGVGYHQQVQVTSGQRADNMLTAPPGMQVIDQVLGAAMSISQGSSGARNSQMPDAHGKAKFCLDVAYTGAYLGAIKRGRKQLFLTILGADGFGNRPEWAMAAILQAHKRFASDQHRCGLERVTLLWPNSGAVDDAALVLLKDSRVPFRIQQYSSGKPTVVESFMEDSFSEAETKTAAEEEEESLEARLDRVSQSFQEVVDLTAGVQNRLTELEQIMKDVSNAVDASVRSASKTKKRRSIVGTPSRKKSLAKAGSRTKLNRTFSASSISSSSSARSPPASGGRGRRLSTKSKARTPGKTTPSKIPVSTSTTSLSSKSKTNTPTKTIPGKIPTSTSTASLSSKSKTKTPSKTTPSNRIRASTSRSSLSGGKRRSVRKTARRSSAKKK